MLTGKEREQFKELGDLSGKSAEKYARIAIDSPSTGKSVEYMILSAIHTNNMLLCQVLKQLDDSVAPL